MALATAAAAGPVHASGNNCEFKAAGTLNLAFGQLDPSAPGATVQATLTGALSLRQFGDCKRATFMVRIGPGDYFNGTRRLKHELLNDYIPYMLDVPDTAIYQGPGNHQYPYTLNFTGTILGRDFVNATAGKYHDNIVVEVNL